MLHNLDLSYYAEKLSQCSIEISSFTEPAGCVNINFTLNSSDWLDDPNVGEGAPLELKNDASIRRSIFYICKFIYKRIIPEQDCSAQYLFSHYHKLSFDFNCDLISAIRDEELVSRGFLYFDFSNTFILDELLYVIKYLINSRALSRSSHPSKAMVSFADCDIRKLDKPFMPIADVASLKDSEYIIKIDVVDNT